MELEDRRMCLDGMGRWKDVVRWNGKMVGCGQVEWEDGRMRLDGRLKNWLYGMGRWKDVVTWNGTIVRLRLDGTGRKE